MISGQAFRAFLLTSLVLLISSDSQAKSKSNWKTSTVGKGGSYSSIAVDGSGRPHISYLDDSNPSNYVLRHAFLNGKKWTVETVDSGDVGWWSSIAIDSLGHIHIAYHADKPTSSLKYAHFDGVAWNITTVAAGGFSNAIAVDSQNRPHISYVDDSLDLNYATHDGSNWVIIPIVGNALWFGDTSIALTSSDKVHISFSDQSLPRGLFWATNITGVWEVSQVGDGRGSSLALDSSDNPHILYQLENTELRYSSYSGGSWVTETLIVGLVDSPSLALDASDLPHICFGLSVGAQVLLYAHFDGLAWPAQVVSKRNSGFDTSIALDSSGLPSLSFRQPGKKSDSLGYAKFM